MESTCRAGNRVEWTYNDNDRNFTDRLIGIHEHCLSLNLVSETHDNS